MVSVIRPEWSWATQRDEWVLYEPVRVRWLAGMIDHRPGRSKGGNLEVEFDLFAAMEPTSWIIEEVNHFLIPNLCINILGCRKRQIEKYN